MLKSNLLKNSLLYTKQNILFLILYIEAKIIAVYSRTYIVLLSFMYIVDTISIVSQLANITQKKTPKDVSFRVYLYDLTNAIQNNI